MHESLKERQDFLFLVTDNLINQHAIWSADTAAQGLVIGGPLWMAADQIVTAFETGTIPASCRTLCRAVENFSKHWREHARRADISPVDNLLPGQAVWTAITSIESAREGAKPKEIKRLESVADLVKQNVTDEQIAKIYGWKTSIGQWDLNKVRDAKANPGKHDGDSYYEEQARLAEERERVKLEQAIALSNRIAGKSNPEPIVGPESIETLAVQGLTLHQIARVKVMDVDDVVDYCKQNAVPVEGLVYEESTPSHASDFGVSNDLVPDPIETADDVDSSEPTEPGDGSDLPLEHQILNAVDANPDAKPGDIAKMLNTSAQRVTSVISRRAEIEHAV